MTSNALPETPRPRLGASKANPRSTRINRASQSPQCPREQSDHFGLLVVRLLVSASLFVRWRAPLASAVRTHSSSKRGRQRACICRETSGTRIAPSSERFVSARMPARDFESGEVAFATLGREQRNPTTPCLPTAKSHSGALQDAPLAAGEPGAGGRQVALQWPISAENARASAVHEAKGNAGLHSRGY